MTNKIKQILGGIFSSAIIWISAILLSGVIVGGELLDLGYSEWGLGRIFFILFLGYTIYLLHFIQLKQRKNIIGEVLL